MQVFAELVYFEVLFVWHQLYYNFIIKCKCRASIPSLYRPFVSSDVFLPFQVKKLLLKSRLVKCFNRCCQDLFRLPCLPPAWGIWIPCPWLVNTIFTLVPYLLFKSVSAHYFPGDVLKFIGSEVREPAVLFENERVERRTHLNLFKWECVFEALHGVSFVMVPSGCAVDSLRFSNEGSLGICLRAYSQSLRVLLWSLPLLLYTLLFNCDLEVH